MNNSTLVYIAAPLFSDSERHFNLELKSFVESRGFSTYLPQLDGGVLADLLQAGMELQEAKALLFQRDIEAIHAAQIILFVLDGRVPDEGACIEAGIGYALGKQCIGLKTDHRSFIAGDDNLMITGILNREIARNFEDLAALLQKARRRIEEGEHMADS
jgi:nucleoside 2-deoxyribosyltransferase